MSQGANRLFIFGLGYTGLRAALSFKAKGWQVVGTVTSADKAAQLSNQHGFPVHVFNGQAPLAHKADLMESGFILSTIPPQTNGEACDPVLRHHLADLLHPSHILEWVGYLSSTGVYGDSEGEWVDESAPLLGTRVPERIVADRAWQEACAFDDLPAHIFRLPGIYGPKRSALERALEGKAHRINLPDHVFSRIHVDDIVGALEASMARPSPGAIFNVADDEPASSADVNALAHELLELPIPPLINLEDAPLSPMGRRFYAECRRVSNGKIKRHLNWQPRYPSYREGLRSCQSECMVHGK